nr:START domain-containing protein [Tanacetum cinerariifolium]
MRLKLGKVARWTVGDADIMEMNLILFGIPNDIYNYVDAFTYAKAMWNWLRRLMHDTNLSEQEMLSRFMNEFDKFTSKFATLQCTQADLLARQLRNSAGSTKRGDEQHGEIRKEEMESGSGSDIHHTRAKKYESVMAGVKELRELFKDGLWIKSSGGGGGDVLDEHKYQQAFLRSSNRNHRPWTTKA